MFVKYYEIFVTTIFSVKFFKFSTALHTPSFVDLCVVGIKRYVRIMYIIVYGSTVLV